MSVIRKPAPAAVEAATALIDELAIEAPEDIDVSLIAAHCGLFTFPGRLMNEEGHLLRAGSHGLAMIAEDALHTRKWRFVLAHELGHFLLHQGHDDFARCTAVKGRPARRRVESEASDFASELLFPRRMLEPMCRGAEALTLAEVQAIADVFGASLPATALRVLTVTEAACAAVHATRGIVDWWAASSAFRGKVRRGSTVPAAWNDYESSASLRAGSAALGVANAEVIWLAHDSR